MKRSIAARQLFSVARHLNIFVAAGLAATSGLCATAQESPNDGSGEIESRQNTVVVTARKRAESAMDIPISVIAVGGEELAARGITTITSLPEVASGVTVVTNANNAVAFRVRGLGSETSSESFEQSVPLFLDGVYQSHGQSYGQALFDLDRVEIVKGTQAALLGKNTSLGAVSIVTRKPGDTYSVNALGSYEFELGSYTAEGGVDIPFSDKLAVRVSGQARRQEGWVANPLFESEYPTTDAQAARAVVQWKPSSNLAGTLVYQGYGSKTLGQPEEYVFDGLGNAAASASAAGYTDFETNLNYSNASSDPVFGETTDDLEGTMLSGTLDYDLGRYTLTSQSAFSEFQLVREFDADLLPGRYSANDPTVYSAEQFSQEFRIASPSDDPVNYVAGLYYLQDTWSLNRTWFNNGAISGESIERAKLTNDAWSVFGQANIALSEKITGTFGLRYTDESRDGEFLRVTTVPGLFTDFLFPPLDGSLSKNESYWDGSLGFEYRPTDGVLVYGSISRGTKGGGFLNLPTNLQSAEFNKEQADTIELGGKLQLGPHNLSAAVFQTEIGEFQQNLFTGTQFNPISAPVTSKGFEFDTDLRIASPLSLKASVTYADSKNDNTGARLQNAPLWSGFVRLELDQQISPDKSIKAQLGANYQSMVLWNSRANTFGLSPTGSVYPSNERTLINGRIGLASDDGWELALVGDNLSDEKYVTYARFASFQTGATTAALGRPRTVSLQLTVRR